MQKLILFRHGAAEDAASAGSDAARALTDAGRQDTAIAARGLASIIGPVALLASSPLVRARQTADILAQEVQPQRRELCDLLAMSVDPGDVLAWAASREAEHVVLVGHEPQLAIAVGLALAGVPRGLVVFRKAGACMLEFGDRAGAGSGLLRWHMEPEQLGRLGTRLPAGDA